MNMYDLFFKTAQEAGLEASELYINKSASLKMNVYKGELENMKSNTDISVVARGIYNGKFGMATCCAFTKDKIEYLVNEIKSNAKVIEKNDPAILFKGSEKYHKVKTFNNELPKVSTEEKKAKLFEIEKAIKAYDKRIVDTERVTYGESESETILMNSYGLKLKDKSNDFYYLLIAVAKENDQVKTGGEMFLDNDFAKFDAKDLVKKAAENVLNKLGGVQAETKKMKAVLDRDVVADLIDLYLESLDAENVQKGTSLLAGKLHQKVASKKFTLSEKPLAKTIYSRWFDDEGVATYNKYLIKNGVLETYLYNLETAAKEGVTTTANGYKAGGKMGTGTAAKFVKPGKKSLEELFAQVGEGIYITELNGLGTGVNPTSGNFSLQSDGYMVRNGKKAEPVLFATSGNLFKLFEDIETVGGDSKLTLSGTNTPSLVIKKLSISGK